MPKTTAMKIPAIFSVAFVLLMSAATAPAQQLNKAGHLVQAGPGQEADDAVYSTKGDEVEVNGLKLKGNSVFRTAAGYVTLSGNYENAPSTVRAYSKSGEELFARTFPQTINFTLSANGEYGVFYDLKQVHLISFKANTVSSFKGSTVFAVSDAGETAVFNDSDSSVLFNKARVKLGEPVYRILFFNGQPLFITYSAVVRIKDGAPEKVYTAQWGRIFDAKVFGDKLYISTKTEKPKKFIFNSYSTSDLATFKPEQEVEYPFRRDRKKKDEAVTDRHIHTSLSNETFLNPMDYFSAASYQPVGNSYCEMQEYSPGNMYPHPGVDLLGNYMQDVYSVKDGYVKAVLTTSGPYHWRIAVANQNTSGYSQGYLYAHLEEISIPYVAGDSVNAGDVLGYLCNFPVQGFVHCHFARIGDTGPTWNGSWWTFDNPLTYMDNFLDSIPPEFERTIGNDAFAFRDVNGNYLAFDSLYGSVKVIAKVYDRINSQWRCDVDELRYSVSPLSSPQTLLLDSFSYEYDFFNDFYYSGSYYYGLLRTIYSRDVTCFSTADYNVRDFYHIITNSDGSDSISGADSMQVFNTLSLPDGSYIFRVIASDPSGNTSRDSMVIRIKNNISGISGLTGGPDVHAFPNPFSDQLYLNMASSENASIAVYDVLGKRMAVYSEQHSPLLIPTASWPKGLYTVVVMQGNAVRCLKVIRI
jgi:murein DD-endopeptidase MepM/ murein hydrolase activator NlpD